jgi:hypothetical protein
VIVKIADRPERTDAERYALQAACHIGLARTAETESGGAHHEVGAYDCARRAARAAFRECPELRG